LVMDAFIALILDDHVMHDDTSSHDLPHHHWRSVWLTNLGRGPGFPQNLP
jgi:hypothetical protein